MTFKIELEDFTHIALAVKPILDTHDVPEDMQFSIVSDIVFEFANFIDERTGTSFHESIYPLLEEIADELSVPVQGDFMVVELDIEFGNGEVIETNVLKSHLEHEENLLLNIEVALEVRDLDEIDDEIDMAPRFSKLMSDKQGIKCLRFLPAAKMNTDDWETVPLGDSKYGKFDESIDGIMACIRKFCEQC